MPVSHRQSMAAVDWTHCILTLVCRLLKESSRMGWAAVLYDSCTSTYITHGSVCCHARRFIMPVSCQLAHSHAVCHTGIGLRTSDVSGRRQETGC